jgi:hypothetical protein
MKETELAEKFIAYFSDFEIYKEVPAAGIIDFIVKNGIISMAVEVKLSLNFEVIEQANRNKYYCDYSYIAVPMPKKKGFAFDICAMLGIGVLTYDVFGVKEIVKPTRNRRHKFYAIELKDYMKRSVAGSQNDRMTPFKATIENMVRYIEMYPGCTLKQCLENVDFHWSNISSAKACVYKWITEGVIKEFRIENNVLILNDYSKNIK